MDVLSVFTDLQRGWHFTLTCEYGLQAANSDEATITALLHYWKKYNGAFQTLKAINFGHVTGDAQRVVAAIVR